MKSQIAYEKNHVSHAGFLVTAGAQRSARPGPGQGGLCPASRSQEPTSGRGLGLAPLFPRPWISATRNARILERDCFPQANHKGQTGGAIPACHGQGRQAQPQHHNAASHKDGDAMPSRVWEPGWRGPGPSHTTAGSTLDRPVATGSCAFWPHPRRACFLLGLGPVPPESPPFPAVADHPPHCLARIPATCLVRVLYRGADTSADNPGNAGMEAGSQAHGRPGSDFCGTSVSGARARPGHHASGSAGTGRCPYGGCSSEPVPGAPCPDPGRRSAQPPFRPQPGPTAPRSRITPAGGTVPEKGRAKPGGPGPNPQARPCHWPHPSSPAHCPSSLSRHSCYLARLMQGSFTFPGRGSTGRCGCQP